MQPEGQAAAPNTTAPACDHCGFALANVPPGGFCPQCGHAVTAAAHLDDQGFLTEDVPCRQCGYDLRGLRHDGNCPECGLPVERSVHSNLVRYSDPAWIRKLRLGTILVYAGFAISILLGIALAVTVSVLGTPGGIGPRTVELIGNLASLAIFLTGGVMILVGNWFLTTPDPSGIGEDDYGRPRLVARILLVISGLSFPVSSAIQLLDVTGIATIVWGVLTTLIAVSGYVALLIYISRFTRRLPDTKLGKAARSVWKWIIGVTASYAVLMTVFATIVATAIFAGPGAGGPGPVFMTSSCGLVIVMLLGVLLFFRFIRILVRLRQRLGEQLKLAAQLSHDANATAHEA
jgi:hypothetical protein